MVADQIGTPTWAKGLAQAVWELGLGELTARVDGSVAVRPGETLRLGHRSEHLYRFDAAGLRL